MRKLLPTIALVSLLALAMSAVAQTAPAAPGQATPDQIQRALNESPGAWADEAIELVVSQGLYIGYPDGTFGWRDNISRAEFAVVLARLIGAYGLDHFNEDDQGVLRDAANQLRSELEGSIGRLDSQQQEIDELRSTVAALESMVMAFEGQDVSADMQAFNDRLSALESEIQNVRSQLDTMPREPGTEPAPVDTTGMSDLDARVSAVESDRARLEEELNALRAERQSLESRIAALESQSQQPMPTTPDDDAPLVTVPDTSATDSMISELRGRADVLDTRLQVIEDDLGSVRDEIADYSSRIDRLERSVLPDRNAFYVNVAIYGTDPDFDLFAKATVGHDSLFGAVGARASFEYSLGAMPHNVSAAFTYRTSFGSTDGYFGLGGGVTLDDPMAPFGEILAGMNFRLTRLLGMYVEGRYRPFFDGGVTPASAGFGAGISVRF